jgi:[glutamine synthetase] adenylyltransferase / [glutamine synthetase]-adenylyl-L-tyrosine phosphorylase
LRYLVLREAELKPALLSRRDTPGLIDALHRQGVFDIAAAARLLAAHAVLVGAGLGCTLDRRARIVALQADIEAARSAVSAVTRAAGMMPD